MEIFERIKELRKEHLHMNQTEFGERLGVSRSVIKNIELNALSRPEQKLSLYKLICSEFNVSEEWLLNGVEPMFVQPDTFSLDNFLKTKGASALELEIIKTYFELDPEIRRTAIEHFRRRLTAAVTANPSLLVPDREEDLDIQCPPVNTNDSFGKNAGG